MRIKQDNNSAYLLYMTRKKPKKIKVPPPRRTQEERQAWVDEIKTKLLLNFGLSEKEPVVERLYEVMSNFIETGESANGKIPFPNAPFGGRTIIYLMSSNKRVNMFVHMPLIN